MSNKEPKVTVVPTHRSHNTPEDVQCMDDEYFKPPSLYYFINALSEAIFIHTRDRQVATKYVADHYDGKYTIRVSKTQKGSGEYTCTGTSTRAKPKSRMP